MVEQLNKFAWHVTPTKNIKSIIENGLCPNTPWDDGDLAISLFKTKEDAIIESQSWLSQKWNNIPFSLIKINIVGLILTETFHYELITTDSNPIKSERFVIIIHFNPLLKTNINKY